MIKTIGLLRAKPGYSREQFSQHWQNVHGALSKNVPGIRRYVQNHVISDRPAQQGIPHLGMQIDGVVEMWYDSLADYELSRASSELKALHADGVIFIGGSQGFIVDERDIIQR